MKTGLWRYDAEAPATVPMVDVQKLYLKLEVMVLGLLYDLPDGRREKRV